MNINHSSVLCTKKPEKSQKHEIVFSIFFVGVFLCWFCCSSVMSYTHTVPTKVWPIFYFLLYREVYFQYRSKRMWMNRLLRIGCSYSSKATSEWIACLLNWTFICLVFRFACFVLHFMPNILLNFCLRSLVHFQLRINSVMDS